MLNTVLWPLRRTAAGENPRPVGPVRDRSRRFLPIGLEFEQVSRLLGTRLSVGTSSGVCTEEVPSVLLWKF